MQATEDLRRAVLDASLALVEEEGLAALSMREVARRAGVSHQAPYHHFKDREGILAALAEEGLARLHAEMVKGVTRARTPLTRLEAVGRTYCHFALGNPAVFKIMHQSELAPIERHAGMQGEVSQVFALLVRLVNETADARGFRGERDALVLTAWSLVHGVSMLLLENRVQTKFPRARNSPEAAIDAVLKTFNRLFD